MKYAISKKNFSFDNIIKGKYYPASFIIGIDKKLNENIKYHDFNNSEICTLIHEYIHFLQDISTTTGYMNFSTNAFYLHKSISLLTKKDIIELPINLSKIDDENLTLDLQSFYEGESDCKKIHHINKIKIEKEFIYKEMGINEDMKQINIYYDDEKVPYSFGSDCICESMAYLIEFNAFQAEKRINEFPYNTCEMICEWIYPEILKYPKNIIALCELSLMHYNSGIMFFCLLTHMKNNKLIFNDINNLFLYFKNKFNFIEDCYKPTFQDSIKELDFLYPLSIVSKDRVKKFLECGYKARINNIFFITNIVFVNNPYTLIKKYIKEFPMPFLLDNDGIFYAEKENLYPILIPFYGIQSFLKYPQDGCGLLDFCKKTEFKMFDEKNCKTHPWFQCNNVELCPFASYLVKYGIGNKQYKLL